MNEEITILCEQLNVTPEQLLTGVAQYKLFDAVGGLVVSLVLLVVCGVCLYCTFRFVKKPEESLKDNFDASMLILLIGIFMFFGVICLFVKLHDVIVWANAPSGAALDYLLKLKK